MREFKFLSDSKVSKGRLREYHSAIEEVYTERHHINSFHPAASATLSIWENTRDFIESELMTTYQEIRLFTKYNFESLTGEYYDIPDAQHYEIINRVEGRVLMTIPNRLEIRFNIVPDEE